MIVPTPVCMCQHTKSLHHNGFGFCRGHIAILDRPCPCLGFVDEELTRRRETRS